MIKIEYPLYQPKIKSEKGKELIFDPYRKKWIILTPEEWVRQHALHHLINRYGVSRQLIESGVVADKALSPVARCTESFVAPSMCSMSATVASIPLSAA